MQSSGLDLLPQCTVEGVSGPSMSTGTSSRLQHQIPQGKKVNLHLFVVVFKVVKVCG